MPSKWELKQLQSLPLEAKIKRTQRLLREFYEINDGNVYLSFSGGKDSTVLADIIDDTSGLWNIPKVYCDTGLEWPEVRQFALNKADIILRPSMPFTKVLENYGYPIISKEVSQKIETARNCPKGECAARFDENSTHMKKYGARYSMQKWTFLKNSKFKISSQCCKIMKKTPFHIFEKERKLYPITATMAIESQLRRSAWLRHGCNTFENRIKSDPISFWTEQDVLQYIVQHHIDYATCYGCIIKNPKTKKYSCTGTQRTGCMFCMYGVHLEKQPNRFQKMKESHPELWNYCINKLGEGEILDFIGVPYE